jgi:hypothetical protein
MNLMKCSEGHRVYKGRLKDGEIFALNKPEKVSHTSGDSWFEQCCETQLEGRGGNPAISSREREKLHFLRR